MAIALLCSYKIQSIAGSIASEYFTREWGGKVAIGTLRVSPFTGLTLGDIELISPTNDTIFCGRRLLVRFSGNPFHDNELNVNKVVIADAYYHLQINPDGINLKYIPQYFKNKRKDKPKKEKEKGKPFVVRTKQLVLNNVEYKMDLKGESKGYEHGVDYKHQHYTGIRARFKDVRVEGPNINCRIVKFAAHEQSGFELTDMSCDATVTPYIIAVRDMELSTGSGTHLLFDALMRYDHWMKHYTTSVMHDITFKKGSVASLQDAAYWAPMLWGFDQKVWLTGYAYGTINDITTNNMHFEIEDLISFDVNGIVRGLPNIDTTYFDAAVNNFSSSYASLKGWHLPERWHFGVPEIMKPLSNIQLKAELIGTPQKCVASVVANTNIGKVAANLSTDYNAATQMYSYNVSARSDKVEIESIVENEWMSHTGFNLSSTGEGPSIKDMAGTLTGELTNTCIRGTVINNTKLNGKYQNDEADLAVKIADPSLTVAMSASIERTGEDNIYTFDANVSNINLTRLHIVQHDSAIRANSHIRANVRGKTIDDLSGQLSLNNSTLQIGSNSLQLHNMLALLQEKHHYKNISLSSDWLRLTLEGYFSYPDLPAVAQLFCNSYLPKYINPNANKSDESVISPDVSLIANCNWHTDYDIFKPIGGDLCVAPNTSLNMTYNGTESMKIVLRSDSMALGSLQLSDIGINGHSMGNRYSLQGDIGAIKAGSINMIENMRLGADLSPDDTYLNITADGNSTIKMRNTVLSMALSCSSDDARLHLINGSFDVAGKPWTISLPNDMQVNRSGFAVPELHLSDGTQWMQTSLNIDKEKGRDIRLKFNDFALSWLSDLMLHNTGFNIEGDLDGYFNIATQDSAAVLSAQLKIADCQINEYLLGEVDLLSDWLAKEQRLIIDLHTLTPREAGNVQPLTATGYLDLSKHGHSPTIDIDCSFDHFPIEAVAPALTSFAYDVAGEIYGGLHIGGSLQQPALKGMAYIKKGRIGVASTHVVYSVDDSVHITDNELLLDNLMITDREGNHCAIDGTVKYGNDAHWLFNLQAHSNRMLIYDMPDQSDGPSGSIYASIQGTIGGNSLQPVIEASAQTLEGSKLTIPISDQKQLSEQNYISFYEPAAIGTPSRSNSERRQTSTPMKIDIDVALTPNLQLLLPINFQQVFVAVQTTGSGNINLSLRPNSTINFAGNYELTSGNIALDLFQLIATNFSIDAGSSIVMPGDINNIRFDIKASRPVRANLASLMGTSVESAARTVTVDDVIAISGTPSTPEVKFDLRFHSADKSVSDEVAGYIDFTNEREVFTQAISLLLTGQFSNTSTENAGGTNLLDNASAGGYNLMAASIGNIVNNVIKGVDINFGYQAETDLTTEQFDVDIRKEWNRLYFETTLGYGGEARLLSEDANNTATNLVGDVLIGYKLNPRLHLFVFNRTNTNDYTRTELPYKQGLGIKLTRDFDNWKTLFKKK